MNVTTTNPSDSTALPVPSYLWVNGERAHALPHHPHHAQLLGQFALCETRPDGSCVLARDLLGVNKLFFATRDDGTVDVANYMMHLRRRGHSLARIRSVPSGHVVRITNDGACTMQRIARLAWDDGAEWDEARIELLADRARAQLMRAFDLVAPAVRGRPLYVTMSGGLDSTGVAVLARERIGAFTGLTFCLGDPAKADVPGSDLHYAKKVAAQLDVPLEVISVSPDELTSFLDTVLVWGQDWRDFNVHCGLVNAALGAWLQKRHAGDGTRPVVLTGDTMNELVADYSPVHYRGSLLYELPRLSVGRLRRFLAAGLDAGDREVGIFAHYGVDALQPYAMCADAYAAIPGRFLELPAAKQRLQQRVLGDRVPAYVYERPKVRAQAGSSSEVGGTLGALLDRGIDASALLARFCAIFEIDPREPAGFIRAGMYRSTPAHPFPSPYAGGSA